MTFETEKRTKTLLLLALCGFHSCREQFLRAQLSSGTWQLENLRRKKTRTKKKRLVNSYSETIQARLERVSQVCIKKGHKGMKGWWRRDSPLLHFSCGIKEWFRTPLMRPRDLFSNIPVPWIIVSTAGNQSMRVGKEVAPARPSRCWSGYQDHGAAQLDYSQELAKLSLALTQVTMEKARVAQRKVTILAARHNRTGKATFCHILHFSRLVQLEVQSCSVTRICISRNSRITVPCCKAPQLLWKPTIALCSPATPYPDCIPCFEILVEWSSHCNA